ncbi:MAG: hypothetical protein IJP29_05770 [Lachnospiraceae bacterium]|nr:hypothetical protein [Lachnospiraceae bacterium]
MDVFDEIEELEFEEVTCNCNLKSNDRFYRLYNVIPVVLVMVSLFFIEHYSLISIVLICVSVVLIVLGALWYIFYSKKNHSIRFILNRDSIVYIDEKEREKRYTLDQLVSIKKRYVLGWGACYRFRFDDDVVNVYDGDDLARLMMGLRTVGKFGLERK